MAPHVRTHGVLTKISGRVRCARRRFGRSDTIDVLAVLFGSAISGERTLEAFSEDLRPFAIPFLAVFERDQWPARSALSRFLAALTEAPVEARRPVCLDDLLPRPLAPDKHTGIALDRAGTCGMVFEVDGTREAARQGAWPQTDARPPAVRRWDEVCAPGYRGRKRGHGGRTRTTMSQAHHSHWLGRLGNTGNGHARVELRQGLAAMTRSLAASPFPPERALLRRDGLSGLGAVRVDLAGFALVTRGKEDSVRDHPLIQARLHLPPDPFQHRPERQTMRRLSECPQVPGGPEGTRSCVVVATHPAGKKKIPVGVTRKGVVSERFFTNLPQRAFTACDVVEVSRHRGACEPILSDEDSEQDPDRWCSHAAWGQQAWHVLSQRTWNRRRERGHQLKPEPLRPTACAPALSPPPPHAAPPSGSAPAEVGSAWKAGRFSGQDVALRSRR